MGRVEGEKGRDSLPIKWGRKRSAPFQFLTQEEGRGGGNELAVTCQEKKKKTSMVRREGRKSGGGGAELHPEGRREKE